MAGAKMIGSSPTDKAERLGIKAKGQTDLGFRINKEIIKEAFAKEPINHWLEKVIGTKNKTADSPNNL